MAQFFCYILNKQVLFKLWVFQYLTWTDLLKESLYIILAAKTLHGFIFVDRKTFFFTMSLICLCLIFLYYRIVSVGDVIAIRSSGKYTFNFF